MIKWHTVKNLGGKTVFYKSDVKQDKEQIDGLMGNDIPKYVVIKEDGTWTAREFRFAGDYLKSKGYIDDVNTIYQNYKSIWSGCKTAKEAKEICQEHESESL